MNSISAEALATVDLPKARAEVLRWVARHPNCTGRELELHSNLRKLNARLPELVKMDVIEQTGERACHITGRNAATYAATGRPAKSLPRRPFTLMQRVELLESQLAELRARNAELEGVSP